MFVARVSLLLMAAFASGWLTFWMLASNLRYGYLGDFTIFWLVGQNRVDWLYTDLKACRSRIRLARCGCSSRWPRCRSLPPSHSGTLPE